MYLDGSIWTILKQVNDIVWFNYINHTRIYLWYCLYIQVSKTDGSTVSIAPKRPSTVGIMDMGGASAQIACK